jgi:MFS family permease
LAGDGPGWRWAFLLSIVPALLCVPQGGLHAFRNDSDAPADMLLLFTPGAPREEYFEQVSRPAHASEEERAAFFDRHDSYFVE